MRVRALFLALAVCGCRVNFDAVGSGIGEGDPDGGGVNGDGVDATALPPTNVAMGQIVAGMNTSMVNASLPMPSTPGTLLVAVLAADASYFTGPAGFQFGCESTIGGRVSGMRYYLNNPGGFTSGTFYAQGATMFYAQLSEWSGVTQTDTSGSTNATGASLTVTSQLPSSGATLGFAIFHLSLASPSTVTFSPSAGWIPLADSGATSRDQHIAAAYTLDAPTGDVSITMSASVTGDWTGCVRTFRP